MNNPTRPPISHAADRAGSAGGPRRSTHTRICAPPAQRAQRSRSRSHEIAGAWPLLHWLLRCPFLRASDLTPFCGVSQATAIRRLDALEREGLVEWVAPASIARQGAQRFYHLTDAGVSVLAAALDSDASQLARTWSCDERRLLGMLPRLPQMARVQSLVGGIVAGAPLALAERGHQAHGAWHWVRDYIHRFSSHRQHIQRLQVNAAVALHVTHIRSRSQFRRLDAGGREGVLQWEPRDRWYSAFIIADSCIQDWAAAARAIGAALSYRESPERWPVYPHFPLLLILADNERHVEHWRRVARTTADAVRLPPLSGAIAVVPCPPRARERGALDPWRLSWVDLVTGASTRLATLLAQAILPHDALPPGVALDTLNERGVPALLGRMPKHIRLEAAGRPRLITGDFRARALAVSTKPDQSLTRDRRGASEQDQTLDNCRRHSSDHGARWHDDLRLLALRLGGRLVEILELLFQAPGIHSTDLAALVGVQLSSMDRYLSLLDHYSLLDRPVETSKSLECDASGAMLTAHPRASHHRGVVGGPVETHHHLSYSPQAHLWLSEGGRHLVGMIDDIGARSQLARSAARPSRPHGPARGHLGHVARQHDFRNCGNIEDREPIGRKEAERWRHDAHNAGVLHFLALVTAHAHATTSTVPLTPGGWSPGPLHALSPDDISTIASPPRLVWWEVGPSVERRYRYQEAWHYLRPDGEGLFRAGQTSFRFWLEWDQGSMNLADLTRKFRSYATYLAAGAWRDREEDAQRIPHLLVVVQSRGQLERMRRAAALAFAELPSANITMLSGASITLVSSLDERGPLASIWWPLLPQEPGNEMHTVGLNRRSSERAWGREELVSDSKNGRPLLRHIFPP